MPRAGRASPAPHGESTRSASSEGEPGSRSPSDEARAVFDTQVLANPTVLRAALAALREARGRIVQTSSLLGRIAWPSSGLYAASKGAVELISEALALEPAPTGVTVTVIEPGTFATEFASSLRLVAPDEVYEPTVGADAVEHIRASPKARPAELDRRESFPGRHDRARRLTSTARQPVRARRRDPATSE